MAEFDEDSIYANLMRYYEKYSDQTIIIKFGGALASSTDSIFNIAQQAAFIRHNMDANVLVVNGGGQQIDQELSRRGIEPARDPNTGLRLTNRDVLDASDSALRHLNGHIVRVFNSVTNRVRALGMAGYDSRIAKAVAYDQESENYTGYTAQIDVDFINYLMHYGDVDTVPVLYSICENEKPYDRTDRRLNVNADDFAAKLAADLCARRLMLCTDTPGILDHNGNVISEIATDEIDRLIEDGTVRGGMREKLRQAGDAVKSMPKGGVALVDGFSKSSILREMLSDQGSGTLIRKQKKHECSDLVPPYKREPNI
jgi:acetylglutamate kinase